MLFEIGSFKPTRPGDVQHAIKAEIFFSPSQAAIDAQTPSPSDGGEVMNPTTFVSTTSFLDRATEGIRHRIPVVPLLPRSKKTYVGAKAATLDSNAIIAWNKENTDYNCGFVAQAVPGGVWILDCDSPEVAKKFEKAAGQPFPRTFAVQSSSGGHRYFRQDQASLTRLRNFSVSRNGKEFFSVRWDNQYCVGPLSIHPDTRTLQRRMRCRSHRSTRFRDRLAARSGGRAYSIR